MNAEILTIILILILLFLLWNYKKKRKLISESRGYETEGYIDSKGYERDSEGQLIHRQNAYIYLYRGKGYPERFGSYDVHHIDRNKRNNSPENLQILTREEHKAKHGIV